MRYTYEAVIIKGGGKWKAIFPQFPDACAYGRTRQEVIENAVDELAQLIARNRELGDPQPRQEHAAEVVAISIDVTRDDVDESLYMTQAQAAEELGVTYGQISKLVKSDQLKSRIIGRRNMVSIESVEAYKRKPRKVGRPPKDSSNA